MDKNTLGYSAILGIKEDAKLTTNQYAKAASIESPLLLSLFPGTIGGLTCGIDPLGHTVLKGDRLLRLGTIFYLSYLIFEYPQNLALQKFPVGKWMRFVVTPANPAIALTRFPSINIFLWSIALLCHAACKNFAELFVVRAILGACEGSITAGLLLSSSMFYTRTEQTLRIGYWCEFVPSLSEHQGLIEYPSVLMNGAGENCVPTVHGVSPNSTR